MSGLYLTTTLNRWEDVLDLDHYFLAPFIYRGQGDSNWSLQASIERVKEVLGNDLFDNYLVEERWMLDEFKRKHHLYSDRQISPNEKFEWLSIMQHHGAPTRLLDFTYSFFIALYFAVIESNTDSSIWAVNRYVLRDNLLTDHKLPYKQGHALRDEVNKAHVEFANKYISRLSEDQKSTTVVPLGPELFSERLSRQQGLFLMPTNAQESFMSNLESAFKRSDSVLETIDFSELVNLSQTEEGSTSIQLIKIDIPDNVQSSIVRHLKAINITSEILFPGLDGLAKSLVQSHIRG